MVQWGTEYSVGIEVIDEQHRCTLNHLNGLYLAMVKRESCSQISDRIDELSKGIQRHFAAEEALMRQFKFDHFSSHKETHDRIIRQITTYESLYSLGETSAAFELTMYLKRWYIKHIQEEDKLIRDLRAEKPSIWLQRLW